MMVANAIPKSNFQISKKLPKGSRNIHIPSVEINREALIASMFD